MTTEALHPSHDTETSSTFPGAEHCRRCGWFTRFDRGPDKPPRVTRKGAAECVPMRIELREPAACLSADTTEVP